MKIEWRKEQTEPEAFTLRSTLTEGQIEVVKLIANGTIGTYGEWFVNMLCSKHYPTAYQRAAGVAPVATKDSAHVYIETDDGPEYFFLKQRFTRKEMRARIFEFMSLLTFLEEHDYVRSAFTTNIYMLRRWSYLTSLQDIYGDQATWYAADYAFQLMSAEYTIHQSMLQLEIVRLPQLTEFVEHDFVTRSQIQQYSIERANERSDRANTRSNWIAGSALAGALIGTIATVLVQSCGTTDVRIVQPYPRVTVRPPALLSDVSAQSTNHLTKASK